MASRDRDKVSADSTRLSSITLEKITNNQARVLELRSKGLTIGEISDILFWGDFKCGPSIVRLCLESTPRRMRFFCAPQAHDNEPTEFHAQTPT